MNLNMDMDLLEQILMRLGRNDELMVPYMCCWFFCPDPSEGGTTTGESRSLGYSPLTNFLRTEAFRDKPKVYRYDLEMLQVAAANPALFQNYREMDDDDSAEETEEEIQNHPNKKMLWAAENNKTDVVQDLVKEDKDLVNSTDSDMYTPLHRACYNGHTDMVRFLLANGANIEAKTVDGWHPIHSAARWNQAKVITLLLESGADINATTEGGQTALHIASSLKDSKETLIILLQNPNLDVDLKNSTGDTAEEICTRTSQNCKLFQQRRDNILKQAETLSLDSESKSSLKLELNDTTDKLKCNQSTSGHVDVAQNDFSVSHKMDKIVEEEELLLLDDKSSSTAETHSVRKENDDIKCCTTSDVTLATCSSASASDKCDKKSEVDDVDKLNIT